MLLIKDSLECTLSPLYNRLLLLGSGECHWCVSPPLIWELFEIFGGVSRTMICLENAWGGECWEKMLDGIHGLMQTLPQRMYLWNEGIKGQKQLRVLVLPFSSSPYGEPYIFNIYISQVLYL